jgi:hypothetical protein
MSSLTTRCVLRMLAASITAAAAPLTNITRLPPAYSARAPFCCSCSIPCSKSAQARLLSILQTHHRRYIHPLISTCSSHIPTAWSDPANSPTHPHHLPFTHDLSLGPGPFLNPNPTRPIIDVIDNRTSQTPPDTHRNTGTTRLLPPGSLQGQLSHLHPTTDCSRHAYERLPCPPIFCRFARPEVYGARDSPRIDISVYECAVRCRGRSSTRVSSWRGRFAQIDLPVLQHDVGASASGRLHEQ